MSQESPERENLYVVMCASGFDSPKRVRSALMFATLAASAEMDTVLYCVQSAVDVMVKGAIEKHETPEPGSPTMLQRLQEAMAMGVRIMCCTQTMKNRGMDPATLIDGVEPAGAMTLIHLTTKAKGTISF
jgi:predicted peroxiredoxin